MDVESTDLLVEMERGCHRNSSTTIKHPLISTYCPHQKVEQFGIFLPHFVIVVEIWEVVAGREKSKMVGEGKEEKKKDRKKVCSEHSSSLRCICSPSAVNLIV